MFAGKDKYEFKEKSRALHDEFAKVNEPWVWHEEQIFRSQVLTTDRPKSTVVIWTNHVATKEEELSDLGKALSSIKMEIAVAERRIKGLSTMVSNLEKERRKRIQEITLLKEQIASQEGDSTYSMPHFQGYRKSWQRSTINWQISNRSSMLLTASWRTWKWTWIMLKIVQTNLNRMPFSTPDRLSLVWAVSLRKLCWECGHWLSFTDGNVHWRTLRVWWLDVGIHCRERFMDSSLCHSAVPWLYRPGNHFRRRSWWWRWWQWCRMGTWRWRG